MGTDMVVKMNFNEIEKNQSVFQNYEAIKNSDN